MAVSRRRGTCVGCRLPRAITVSGVVGMHRSPGGAACPGAGCVPLEATLDALTFLISQMPVAFLDGEPVVRLADLEAAIDEARHLAEDADA